MKGKYHNSIQENSTSFPAFAKIQLVRDKASDLIALRLNKTNHTFNQLFGSDYTVKSSKLGVLINHKKIQGETNWLELFDTFSTKEPGDFFKLSLDMNGSIFSVLIIVVQNSEFDLFLFDSTYENNQYMNLKKILNISEEFLQFNGTCIDYQKIVDDFLCFCAGKYAVFNLFSLSGETFTTRAITGDKGIVNKISRLLGYELIGKEWPYDPVYFERINQANTTYFKNLQDIVGNVIPKPIIYIIENLFDIGEIVVIKIMRNEKILGEFTIFMDKQTKFIEESIADIYTKQVGLLLTRFNLEKEMIRERNFLKTTLMSIADGVITTDLSGTIVLVNKAAEGLMSMTSDEMIGVNIDQIFKTIDENNQQEKRNIIHHVIETGLICEGDSSTLLTSRNGYQRPIEQTASPILDDEGKLIGTVLVFRDIYNRKKKQNEIRFLSFHDQLTGLYNRRFYEEEAIRLDHERNLPLSVIIGDINGLKLINDSFGHHYGDQLIMKAAEIIKKGIRASDVAARLGGDEFIILLPSTDQEQVEEVIERIKDLASHESVGATTLSISFGYGTKKTTQESMKDIIKIAEDFMYKHKLYYGSSIRHSTIDLIMKTLFEKNEREMHHTTRVSEMCEQLGVELGYDSDHIQQIKLAGLLHDIGKIGIDESILNNREKLNDEEWYQMKRHSEIGYRILSSVNDFAEIANYVLEHHEKIDGSGYPRGLIGDEISKQARIIAIVDSFDAMTSERSYGKILTIKETIIEIKRCSGMHFDPEIAKVFVEKVLKEKW